MNEKFEKMDINHLPQLISSQIHSYVLTQVFDITDYQN